MPAIFARRLAFATAMAGLCSTAALADAKPDIADLKTAPITVNARAFTAFARSGPDRPLGKLTFLGGLVLSSPSPYFGGWSGLVLNDAAKSFLAISDTGVWLKGDMTYVDNRLSGISNASLGPLLEKTGRPIVRSRDRDSESIALESGTFDHGSVLIGFEGRHRIERYDISPTGVMAADVALRIPPSALRMDPNKGFEALTLMKGGRFKGCPIAFSERLYDPARNHTGWIWTKTGPRILHLKNVDDFDITDIASLEDGTLFVLERRFRWLEGVKMRLVRIEPDALAPDEILDGETLIEADMESNIDNMEGLAVTRPATGGILITMISDDNFNYVIQRTLLLQFLLKETRQAKARLPN